MIGMLYAQSSSAQGTGQGGFIGSLIMLGIIFLIFYLLLILPAKKRQKKHQQMINSLQVGDGVITAGGIVGKVTAIYEDRIEIDSLGTKLEVVKNYITAVTNKR